MEQDNLQTHLSLTQDEAYILSLFMGSVRYCDNAVVNALLDKTAHLYNAQYDDYSKVVFYVNEEGNNNTGKVGKENLVVISFEGTNLSDDIYLESMGSGWKDSDEDDVSSVQTFDPLAQLYNALSQAITDKDLVGVTTYSNAIQTMSAF